MTSNYLPTTDEVMQGWTVTEAERRAWLAEHDRAVAGIAWEDGYDAGVKDLRDADGWRAVRNPYRGVSNKTLEEKVMEAIGAASMCWQPAPDGVFDMKCAREIGIELFHEIWDAIAEAWSEGQQDQLKAQEIALPRGVTIPLASNPYRTANK